MCHIASYQDCVNYLLNISDVLKSESNKNGYDYIVTSIVNPLRPREFSKESLKVKHQHFTRSDLILSSNDWYYKFIFKITETIDCDSADEGVRLRSEQTLLQELALAEHYNTGNILIKLKSGNNVNLARLISRNVKGSVAIELPMTNYKHDAMVYRKDVDEQSVVIEDTWQWWNNFRFTADFNSKIKLALELSIDIPSNEEVLRWLGEPIDAIIIPAHLFLLNKSNLPVLSKRHQTLLKAFIPFHPNIMIKAGGLTRKNINNYCDYIKHFVKTERHSFSKHSCFDAIAPYEDQLQFPLQPLYDNLDTATYETFEKDPVKYLYYQKAVEMALIDKVPANEIEKKKITVMVVGAGRGPLVRASLNAAANTRRMIKVYIIEKNPNAVVTLSALVKELWSDKEIEIISCDMRDFTPPEKVDILVSELLGSFGDNELSPECLDGAQLHLKPDGISIPCEYSNYLNPVMSSKLYNTSRPEKTLTLNDNPVRIDELTYVVFPKNVYYIDEPQKLFTFVHPNKSKIIDNARYKTVDFNVSLDCVLNGFVGYFDCILYKDITLSIHPHTHTQGLVSWFPFYLPISEPYVLKKGDKITMHLWRCLSGNSVWYEWCTSAPFKSHIHNRNGRAIKIYK